MATLHRALRHALTPARPTSSTGSRGVRRARRLRSGLLVGAIATLALTLLPGTAAAEPEPATTPEQAAQLVADAGHRLGVVTEEVNQARVLLEREQEASAQAESAAGAASRQLTSLDAQLRTVARAAYTGGGMTQLDVMLSSSSAEEFLSRLGTLDVIAGHTADLVVEVSRAADAADRARTEAADAAAAARDRLAEVTAKQEELRRRIADYQAQYDALSAAQQQQVLGAEGGQAVTPPPSVTAPSGATQTAVDTALAQVGDPYVWGGAGPDSFDCSGLTMFAYAAAGIALPHSSRIQATLGRAVSVSELQPGDLLFFYSPISHESMYIGNGMMVHAATPGTPVKVVPLNSMIGDLAAARRIVG